MEKYFFAAVAFFAVSPVCAYAATDGCEDVLRYTGRETRVFYSKELGQKYAASLYSRQNSISANGTIPIGEVAGIFGGTYDSAKQGSDQKFEEWENTLFREEDTVFAPAIAAWRACKEAAANDLKFVPVLSSDGLMLTISIERKSALPNSIEGIVLSDENNVSCKFNDVAVNSTAHMDIPIGNSTIICRRNISSKSSSIIDVNFLNGHYDFILPELKIAPPKNVEIEHREIEGCPATVIFDPVNYDRTVYLSNFVAHADWNEKKDGGLGDISISIYINDRILTGTMHRRYKDYSAGDYTLNGVNGSTPSYRIDAFLPAVIHIDASVLGGHCTTAKADIAISK